MGSLKLKKKKPHVLILLQNIPITRDVRVQKEISILQKAGFKVSVIAPSDPLKIKLESLKEVDIFCYKSFAGNNAAYYLIEYIYSFFYTLYLSFKIYFKEKFDIIHACNPPDIFFPIAFIFKLLGKRFVYDQHDLCPELYLSRFKKPRKFIYKILLLLEKATYKLADVVIVTNESAKKIALNRGKVPSEKIFVVRNGPFLETDCLKEQISFKKNGFIICYIGRISPQDGVDYLLKAAHYLVNNKKRRDIKFVVIGDGDSIPYLKKLANNLNLNKYVDFKGWVSDKNTLREYLAHADVCVSPEPLTPYNERSTFIKIMDYMAFGKPIVAFDLPETRYSAQKAALYARPNDIKDFAEKIEEFLSDVKKREKAGLFGFRRVREKLSWEYSEPALINAYNKLKHSFQKTRKILILNETPVPTDERTWLEAKSLSKAGYRVFVICTRGEKDKKYEEIEGVQIYRYKSPPPTRGLASYAFEFCYCLIRTFLISIRIFVKFRFDVVHACNPPDTFFLIGMFYKLLGRKFVFAQHDLCPELYISRFAEGSHPLLLKGLYFLERMSYKVADMVITTNESYRKIALNRGDISPERLFVVRNGPNLEKFKITEPDISLKKGRRFLVCYLGVMNPQDGVDYLLKAAHYLIYSKARKDAQFALIGAGDIEEDLKEQAKELGLEEYVTFTGWISDPNLLSTYLSTADVCVVPDPKTPLNEVSSFMKVMDYMAVRKPIVAFDLPETRYSAQKAALYARPNDIKDFAEKIDILLNNKGLREALGSFGRRRVEKELSWEHCERKLWGAYAFLFGEEDKVISKVCEVKSRAKVKTSSFEIFVESQNVSLFLDFWKLPHTSRKEGEPNLSIIDGNNFETTLEHALIILSGKGKPALYSLDNGIHFFAKVCKLKSVPPGFKVLARILNKRGQVVSYILENPSRHQIFIPFSINEVFESFYYEKYLRVKKILPTYLLKIYYVLKSYLPDTLILWLRTAFSKVQKKRKFPQWPAELSFEDFKLLILKFLLHVSRKGEIPFIWFWPQGKKACLLLTHDVERKLNGNKGIFRLISIEKQFGFRSSFNVVPFKYEVDKKVLKEIRDMGHEIGVHGFSHDGQLFSSWRVFSRRVGKVNEIAREWNAFGFRSASTYRNPDWYSLMEFKYDASFFDTDPYEPQPGGCLSFFPYFIGKMVEIPMTLPQDYTLFVLLRRKDIHIWKEKSELIMKRNGLICLNTHPDEGYIGDEVKEKYYIEFLGWLRERKNELWNPLPYELSEWWRARKQAQIICNGEDLLVKGGSSEMVVYWARLEKGELSLEEIQYDFEKSL